MSRRVGLAALVLATHVLSGAAAATAPGDAEPGGFRRPFVIGSPGRLDGAGDRRRPRRWFRSESAIDAYADVEEVDDATWLRHELEGYVLRIANCAELGSAWCWREVRRIGADVVSFVAAGVHAEIAWIAHDRQAVRLGWRRVVEAPTGTLTADTPPADFAAALLAEFPSQLGAERLAEAHATDWRESEVDRLLYYIDRALSAETALPQSTGVRRRTGRFVADTLVRIARLEGLDLDPEAEIGSDAVGGVLPPSLADQLGSVREWLAIRHRRLTEANALPWCAVVQLSSLP
jgi:hypothetical protein